MSTPASRTSRRTSVQRRAAAALLSVVAATTLAACGSDSEEGSSEEGFGTISMQYSWIKNEEFAGEFYAEDKGYYEEAGFDAVNGISGPDTGVAKLLSGKVQVAINDAASVGSAIAEQEAPLKIIGATFQKNPFTILSLKDGGNIATPADLKGKKIGVQDSNVNVFKAILAANGLEEKKDDITVVPVEFDPTPLMEGQVDGFMAYLTNESITVELAGHEVTNLPYAENGVPYVAETYTVTDQYLAENRDLLKALLTAEIKGWTETFKNPSDEVVKVVTKHYNEAASDSDGLEASFGELDPVKTKRGLEESQALISTPETEKNGLFTISEELQQQTVDSLAAAGWEVSTEDLFDTSIIDEIYEENPELKAYQK
ncbi:ABC-type nitrate/sulfonate/bicarbonate transport system, substrate-binding protein [Nocardioides sp. YR527]|uniref:ABC transporter substrate-binding protein n=1 Tax=Nocardioides sp. YR527 TaxID=1881028 RepID=UPI00088CEB6C|nr:ABC transporter substrate-binding protein [Nocardioides sp. YR527]SDK78108.1 ABC-type nitrate/sulfonate/bicarbonate transport system, substrate-binding protein [Nocardioides sp. YR527]